MFYLFIYLLFIFYLSNLLDDHYNIYKPVQMLNMWIEKHFIVT